MYVVGRRQYLMYLGKERVLEILVPMYLWGKEEYWNYWYLMYLWAKEEY